MFKYWPVCLLICSCAFKTVFAAEEKNPGAGTIGIAYDEGLSGKYYLLDNVFLKASLFYSVIGARDTGDQPLNTFAIKVGGGYVIGDYGKLRLSAFGEIGERLHQDQTAEPTIRKTTGQIRYNLWDTYFRAGVCPELFINQHFSIDYKFGIEFAYMGTSYIINQNKDGVQSLNNDYGQFRTYGLGESFGNAGINDVAGSLLAPLLINIGFNFYF
jgi:hypothetical protein